MYSLETNILKKRFSKTADPSFPDQEVYPNLPVDVEGKWQPQLLGIFNPLGGTELPKVFLNSVPTMIIDPGIEQEGTGKWRARKFKITATVKNPETGHVHGLLHDPVDPDIFVLRYQDQFVTPVIEGPSGSGNHFQFAANNTEIHFHNTAAAEIDNEALIRVYAAAFEDDAVGTFTGGMNATIQSIPDVIHFCLTCFANVSKSRLDIPSLTAFGNVKQGFGGTFRVPSWFRANNVQIRTYFDSQITVQEYIDILAFSIGHKLFCDQNGVYSLRPLPERETTAGTSILVDADITDWTETLRLDSFQNRIVVKYFQIPAGDQELDFNQRKKKKKKPKIVTFETEAFHSVRNNLQKDVGTTVVKDDLLYAIGKEAEPYEVITYYTAADAAQSLADYLYLQWGNGVWQPSFTDAGGVLLSAAYGDVFTVHRKQSAYGDISYGRPYRLIDATAKLANNATVVTRADEVKYKGS